MLRKICLVEYEVFIQGGKKNIKQDPVKYAMLMENMGAGELFLNSIDRDGTLQGYDIELIKENF